VDLQSLVYSDTAVMEITNHDGSSMESENGVMSIEFYGADTDEQLRAYRRYRLASIEAGKDEEDLLLAECKLLKDLTSRFNNVIYNGEELTLKDGAKAYREIIKLRNQAIRFVGNNENFIQGQEKKL